MFNNDKENNARWNLGILIKYGDYVKDNIVTETEPDIERRTHDTTQVIGSFLWNSS